jgi:hypothetical protein
MAQTFLSMTKQVNPRESPPTRPANFSSPGPRLTSKLAWSIQPDDDIFTGASAGGTPTNLTGNASSGQAPAWSPDGTMLVFSRPSSPRRLITMSANGGTQIELADGEFPSWGPLPSTPTSAGNDVSVTFGATTVIFDNVTTAGATTINPVSPVSGTNTAPTGYVTIAGAGMAFDISTTASNSGPITLCFTVSNITDRALFDSLRVQHGENGQLVDGTILSGVPLPPGCDTNLVPNFTNKTICACVTSLSPFMIMQRIDTAKPQITGLLVDEDGNPLPRITVELSGVAPVQTLTDFEGRFTFANLETTNSYTIFPLAEQYDLTPPLAAVRNPSGTTTLIFVASAKTGPLLTIQPDPINAGVLNIIWQIDESEFVLESTDSLAAPNWILVSSPPAASGNNFVVSLQSSGSTRFFRLRR